VTRYGSIAVQRMGETVGVLVTLDLYVKPDRLDEFLGVLQRALPDTRAYQGCESLETFTDVDHPGHVILVERWSERAAHERYFAWREEQGMRAVIVDFLASEEGGFHYFEPRPDV
jgi:quinol monooxygenase YgiN